MAMEKKSWVESERRDTDGLSLIKKVTFEQREIRTACEYVEKVHSRKREPVLRVYGGSITGMCKE